MSTCADLARIFERIQSRLERGASGFNLLMTLLSHRVEVETKYSSMLKELIPGNIDESDQVLTFLVEELNSEVKAHATFASDIRSKVLVPMQTYLAGFRDKHGPLSKSVKKEYTTVKRALQDIDNAQRDLDTLKGRMEHVPTQKIEAHQAKIQRATIEVQRKKQIERQTAVQVQSHGVPAIHRDLSELDSARLQRLQWAAVTFEGMKKSLNEAGNLSIDGFQARMTDYDGKDRSSRFIQRVFDGSDAAATDSEPSSLVTAIADYMSDDPRDLAFEKGDKIQVLVPHSSGWWEGSLNGARGMFPRSFVVLPAELRAKNEPIGAVFAVVRDFVPGKGTEMPLLGGDLVYVDFITKGRCSGTCLRNGKRGFFPLEILEQRLITDPKPRQQAVRRLQQQPPRDKV
jgi:hypothetical protein